MVVVVGGGVVYCFEYCVFCFFVCCDSFGVDYIGIEVVFLCCLGYSFVGGYCGEYLWFELGDICYYECLFWIGVYGGLQVVWQLQSVFFCGCLVVGDYVVGDVYGMEVVVVYLFG